MKHTESFKAKYGTTWTAMVEGTGNKITSISLGSDSYSTYEAESYTTDWETYVIPDNVNYIRCYGIVGCHHKNNFTGYTDLFFNFKINGKTQSVSDVNGGKNISVNPGDVVQYSVSVDHANYTCLVRWSIDALLINPISIVGNLIVNGTDTGSTTGSGTVMGTVSVSAKEKILYSIDEDVIDIPSDISSIKISG